MTLEIKNVFASIDGKEILKGVSLTIEKGEIVALMGPNGSGKSTLANLIMGNPTIELTSGKIILNGKDITTMSCDERSRKGLFLSFQQPPEISGVTFSSFLRSAINSHLKQPLSVPEFSKLLKEKMSSLNMDPALTERYLNEGFSGGERKKNEILQLSLLEPNYALLDETDSGLDIDALKTISKNINKIHSQQKNMGILIITHYQRILDYIKPNSVYVLQEGKITINGGPELVKQIEEKGYNY